MRLRQLTGRVQNAPDLGTLLAAVLDAALAQTSADFGNVQIFEPGTGALRIASQSGFSSEFLEYFAVVDDGGAACGRAAGSGAQVVIVDVATDPGFAPNREIAAATGFRASHC
jgi:GAF domain-containing protein